MRLTNVMRDSVVDKEVVDKFHKKTLDLEKKFIEAITQVKPGLSSKDNLEQSSSVIFKDGMLFSYNDEIAIRHPLDFEIEDGAIPAKELLKILTRLKEDEITIEMKDEEIRFKGKRANAGVRREIEIQLPIDETKPPKKFTDLPENFLDAVSFCLGTISNDISAPLLHNLSIQEDSIQSSDNYRISIFDLSEEMKPFLLPASSARQLLSYNPSQYAIDKAGFVHFKTDKGSIFSCRTSEGEFKDLRKNTKVDGVKLNLPSKMEELLDIAGTFIEGGVGDTDGNVDVSIKDNWLLIKGQSESGWATAKERIKYTDDPIEFMISCQSLLAILGDTTQAELTEKVLVFEGEGFTYLTCIIPGEGI